MVLVFAYGSNLCIERLHARTPGARVVDVATLRGYALRWHKRSRDGSGKCNIVETGNTGDLVWGVVYELTPEEKLVLDVYEGLGEDYFEKVVSVDARGGNAMDAVAYVANPSLLDESVRPYRWYKGFVVAGAEQHGFPDEYVALLAAIEEHEAEDERHAHEWEVLEAALSKMRKPRGDTR